MANSRSGSLQRFAIADVPASGNPTWTDISGPESGFTGFNVTPTPSTYENTSAGLTVTKKGGHVQRAGEFGVGETAETIPFLLGRNGRRLMVRNRPQGDGAGLPEEIGEVTCIISRTFAGRAQRTFEVSCNIDGAFPETDQS